MKPRTHLPKMSPRRRALLAGMAALLLGVSVAATAQDYPNRPIRLVIPYPPGGATDVIGRMMAQKLSAQLGQQVIADNRAGAGGSIGASLVAKAPADGYTLLMGAMTSHAINAILQPHVEYDMEKSFAPVAIVGAVPLVIVVNPNLKIRNVPELIAAAKASPGTLTYGSAGTGSPQHLAGEMFQRMTGVKMLHVPYKGSGPALIDLVGGQIDAMFETVPAAQAMVKAGKLRAIAVTSATRIPAMPDVPTAAESSLTGFEVSSMFGIAAPAGTPAPVITRLNDALNTILSSQDTRDSMLSQGVIASYTTPEQASKKLVDESAKWRKVIREGNIRIE